jgi:hypothetical protein
VRPGLGAFPTPSVFAFSSPLVYTIIQHEWLPPSHVARCTSSAWSPPGLEALELQRAASVARFVYNWALGQSKAYYQQHGKSKQWGELSADLTQLKRTELWLYDCDSQMLQQALADLRRAYINFFEGRAKFPRFKTKSAPGWGSVSPNGSGSKTSASMCPRLAGSGFANRRPSSSRPRARRSSALP